MCPFWAMTWTLDKIGVLYLPVDLLLMSPALAFLSGLMLSFAQTPPAPKSHTYIPAEVAAFRLHGSVVRNSL